jgi:hypothetical protein
MKIFSKTIFILPFLISALFVFIAGDVNAQQYPCTVSSATFRTTKAVDANFFEDNMPPQDTPPYVYIDIQTANCDPAEIIKVSIIEDNAVLPDTEVNGQNGILDPCTSSSDSCMNKRQIPIPNTPAFTLALRAGEDECQTIETPNCQYFLKTWDEANPTNGNVWTTNAQLNFLCDGECTTDWQYIGVLQPSGSAHPSDPDNQGSGGDGGDFPDNDGNNGEFTGSQGGGQTEIAINLENPLAGTIDTIPQLFQKIVEIIIKIGIPLIAMAIVYSGLLFVTARGSDEQLKKAKSALLFAVIGGLILLASWLVAEAIKDALTSFN